MRDSGVGIAADLMPHLFEPFTQGPQPMDRGAGGLGLGLAMVKGLVELHSGTVTVASEGVGRGTEVRVLLPAGEPPAPAPVAEAVGNGRRRVLVIEDNPDSAESLSDFLELHGHEVRIAQDGAHGLEIAKGFRPEVVICDLGLPGMDGFQTARALRADERLGGVYLVALSGYAADEDRQRAAASGFDLHVAKPPDLDALVRVVADAPASRVTH